jgi:hypothetical protein
VRNDYLRSKSAVVIQPIKHQFDLPPEAMHSSPRTSQRCRYRPPTNEYDLVLSLRGHHTSVHDEGRAAVQCAISHAHATVR